MEENKQKYGREWATIASQHAPKQRNRVLQIFYDPHFAPPLAFQLKHPQTPVAPLAATLIVSDSRFPLASYA
ncbi:hypothetical protein [Bradyrhizobium manausense]|uniref:Uncharacterized protein n=1 Tax=Bradyrhizobium manausense TaxID=989370 RepID=A0A0R3CSK0_9BRAD|nr:hypothetical protein [Bradyrhizobium manausense]KRQ00643.1 hypothetical protein AOQ71_36995 [Bradyrhizobium manausense]